MSAGAIYAGRVTGPFLFGRIDRSHPLRKTIPKQRFVSSRRRFMAGHLLSSTRGKKNITRFPPLIDKQWCLRTILPPPPSSSFNSSFEETLPGFRSRENWKIFQLSKFGGSSSRVALLTIGEEYERGGKKREGGGRKGQSRAHVATINLHSDVIGEEQVTEQEDSLSGG